MADWKATKNTAIVRDRKIAYIARMLCREFMCPTGPCRVCTPGSLAFEIARKIVDSL